tara:strand:+ start:25934 stop:27316 length:1383 start_codon:yes stop_codon:yes gene_type:complete
MSDKLKAARYRASKLWVYLGTALWSMVPVENKNMPITMGVDKWWRLYYHPKLIEEEEVATLSTVLLHEVSHLLRDHHLRGAQMGVEAWDGKAVNVQGQILAQLANIASDAEINDNIARDSNANWGDKFKDAIVTPAKIGCPEDWLFEQYFRHLQEKGKAQCNGDTYGLDGQPTSGKGESLSDQARELGEGETMDIEIIAPNGEVIGRSRFGGSAGHGGTDSWEEGAPDGENSAGVNKGRQENIKGKVAQDVRQHSRSRGTLPAGWEQWADDILEPKVSWQREIKCNIRNMIADVAGQVDYTYKRPSRRASAVPNVVLPSMKAPRPEIAIVVDTSGSMGHLLSDALAEVKGVLKASGLGQVTVLPTDAAVHATQRVFKAKQVKLLGGGGTDMGVGLKAAAALKPAPQIVIVLTDMYTPWPDKCPGKYKTIIGALGDDDGYSSRWDAPEWAKVINISTGDKQ